MKSFLVTDRKLIFTLFFENIFYLIFIFLKHHCIKQAYPSLFSRSFSSKAKLKCTPPVSFTIMNIYNHESIQRWKKNCIAALSAIFRVCNRQAMFCKSLYWKCQLNYAKASARSRTILGRAERQVAEVTNIVFSYLTC